MQAVNSVAEIVLGGVEEGAGAGGAGDTPTAAPEPEPTSVGEPSTAVRILIVEDEYLVAMEMDAGLREAGYDVVGTASTADEAVALARDERPRLVVMDIRLVGARDGVDAATDIYRGLGIRSIFASAHSDDRVRSRAAAARPLGWIAKPYRASDLVRAVGEALKELEG